MGAIQRNTIGSVIFVGLLALTWLFPGGCAKKLDGSTDENLKPLVWFVNVPPNDATSSTNPIVNWLGTDKDGQIDYYRYIVVREDDMGALLGKPAEWTPYVEPLTLNEITTFLDNVLPSLDDTLWTVLYVRASDEDPHTSNIIPMSAEMSDPVRVYVPQFVFVQAYDAEGLGSDIVYRRFLRNDNPPDTRVVGFIDNVPYINAVTPEAGGEITGMRFRWTGSDVLDYPTDAPPFEFEWQILGPYADAEYQQLVDSFIVPCFVTTDAQVFLMDNKPDCDSAGANCHPTWHIVCDTTYPSGVETVDCDTILVDTITANNIHGRVDTLFRIEDDDFLQSSFNKVASRSDDGFGGTWVTDTRDSMYNLYWNTPSDTTQQFKFMFVIRSRDDAQVPDLTPAFKTFELINPHHERDVLVFNWSNTADEHNPRSARVDTFWNNAVNNWITQTGKDAEYIRTRDYVRAGQVGGLTNLLKRLLSYKIVINVQDGAVSGSWANNAEAVSNVFTALQSSTMAWSCTRVPIGSFSWGEAGDIVDASSAYTYYFGLEEYEYTGWGYYSQAAGGYVRIEDFSGALTLDPARWPELKVDTARLHFYYDWADAQSPYVPGGWNPSTPALPEVGWCVRSYDTEVIYLYKSMYGSEHPIFSYLSFQGRPVAHRLNRGLFRTVQWLFTPLGLEQTSAQVAINNTLDWLWDGWLNLEVAGKRGNAANSALSAELGGIYWKCYWEANGDRERFYELLQDAY